MTINGYSERGIMNALFYGMASKENDSHVREFLKVAGIDKPEVYNNFNIIMEGSLSDFGDPDAIIIAENIETKTVFFVEAKVSNGKIYSLQKQYDRFNAALKEDATDKEKYYDGYSSNLFYQLSLKDFFFRKLNGQDLSKIKDYIKNRKNNTTERKEGKNKIVQKIIESINYCDNAEFIAITPDDTELTFDNTEFKINNLHFVTWEKIASNSILKDFVGSTLDFNNKDGVDLIRNKDS